MPHAMMANMDGTNFGAMPTRTAAIVERLRDEIREGTLAPGTRLRQAHLAKDFGVSTTPIREAFAALEREGLIESSAHRGVVVFEPTIEDLEEIYEIRVPLEALATEMAVPNLTAEDLDQMALLLEGMALANKEGQPTRSAELNHQFHLTIYQASGKRRLTRFVGDLRTSSLAYIDLYPQLVDRFEETEAEHAAILAACKAHDAKRAGKAMAAHLKHTVSLISGEIGSG
jgi:DNA-binding GntR family transcriptional regulator